MENWTPKLVEIFVCRSWQPIPEDASEEVLKEFASYADSWFGICRDQVDDCLCSGLPPLKIDEVWRDIYFWRWKEAENRLKRMKGQKYRRGLDYHPVLIFLRVRLWLCHLEKRFGL